MVSYTKSSISTRSRSNTSTSFTTTASFTTASATSTARAAYHSSSVNRRKPTYDSSNPPASLLIPATIKAEESTKTDEPGPVWAVTPFCYYNPSSRDTYQSGSRLLLTASYISRLNIKTSLVTTYNRDSKHEPPFPDAKPTSGIPQYRVEVLYY